MKVRNLRVCFENLEHILNKPLKIIKKTTIVIAATAIVTFEFLIRTFIIGGSIYTLNVHSNIEKIKYDSACINQITEYYEDKGPIEIITFNDSQGVNMNACFWENSFPEYIEDALASDGNCVNLIDTSSFKFNKTNHIDKMIYENLDVKEIKLLNLMGAKSALSKVADDIGSPIDFGFAGALFCEKLENGDENIHITDCISDSNDPIILYYSGANDLMRELNNNPAAMKKYDSNGNINESFLYSEAKSNYDQTLINVMNGIEENFKNIYAVNNTSKIFALSLYVPEILNNDDMKPFTDLIKRFNIELEKLCKKYGVTYISNEKLGALYSKNNGANFHISEVGHKELAIIVLESIRDRLYNPIVFSIPNDNIIIADNGLAGFAQRLCQDAGNVPLDNISFNQEYLNMIKQTKEVEIYGESLLADRAESQYVKSK